VFSADDPLAMVEALRATAELVAAGDILSAND